MRVDKYFEDTELNCKCGCGLQPSEKAFDALTAFRRHYERPVTVTSGARCKAHNEKVGGKARSRHLTHRDAFDIKLSGGKNDIPRAYYIAWLCGFRGIATVDFNNAVLHIDMRENSTTWQY